MPTKYQVGFTGKMRLCLVVTDGNSGIRQNFATIGSIKWDDIKQYMGITG